MSDFTGPLSLENLDAQFCSDWLKDEIRRVLTYTTKLEKSEGLWLSEVNRLNQVIPELQSKLAEAKGLLSLSEDEYVRQVGEWKIIQRLEEQLAETQAKLGVYESDVVRLVREKATLEAKLAQAETRIAEYQLGARITGRESIAQMDAVTDTSTLEKLYDLRTEAIEVLNLFKDGCDSISCRSSPCDCFSGLAESVMRSSEKAPKP